MKPNRSLVSITTKKGILDFRGKVTNIFYSVGNPQIVCQGAGVLDALSVSNTPALPNTIYVTLVIELPNTTNATLETLSDGIPLMITALVRSKLGQED